jgi:hypothetical protein
VADFFALESAGQAMVPVEVNLQPEGTPGREPQITQAQLFIDEIEVVVKALAVVRAQVGLAVDLLRLGW